MDERIPAYLARRLSEVYADSGRIEEGFGAKRPVTLRVNRLVATPEKIREQLDAVGIRTLPVPWYEDAWVLPEADGDMVEHLPMYERGEIYLQGLSAMLPPLFLDAGPGQAILDMAAAPGGKTTQIAAMTGGKASITACERDRFRAERLRYNLKHQHVMCATVLQSDARQLDDAFRFDRILLDAPCTGSGTLSLLPGVPARRMTDEWVRKILKTQQGLINKAVKLLSRGGRLVYSTCSILPEENEKIVQYAMERGMKLVPVDEKQVAGIPCLPVQLPGTLCVCPSKWYEGFFVAVLQKD